MCAGSPYEMGYAHGQLMKERAESMLNNVWQYLEQQIVSVLLHSNDHCHHLSYS